MISSDLSSPQPSLESGGWKPSSAYTAPIVNSVESQVSSNLPIGANSLTEASATPETEENTDWLQLARNAYNSSDSWMQINLRATWMRNIAHYRSEHAADSPIMSEANKHRSNYFWPKTRTLVRSIQAAAASAFFTSADVVVIEAEDQDDDTQREAAGFMKQLINYRLTQTIPWYQILLGGTAEAAVIGTVVSHQSWDYQEKETIHGYEIDEETGETVEVYSVDVKVDRPNVRLVPAENIRISPASDWLDPANSSPYFIELMPMFLGDVQAKIKEAKDPKNGEPSWKDIGDHMLVAAGSRDNLDTTRRARAGQGKLDPKSNTMESEDDFKVVWIHRNIVRKDGEDWLYYTAGTTVLLSDPVLLSTVIPWADGKRDYVLGRMEVETDRVYASSPVEIVSGMQRAVNELKNQRYDNVRQVLNRRYLYRAGSQVDVKALSRNTPGGLIGISAPGALDSHVSPLPVQDVTASSYQEEDRISLAMDDLSGSTTGSTVNSNRKLNETATGMKLMSESGNMLREMELRTITKTWVEGVIRQLCQLEAMYETNTVAMTVAAKKAKILRILPEYFTHRFSVSINVGMGSVSPTQRMEKITTAISTVVQLVPDAAAAINGQEIAKEVFGAAGYDNGDRFFDFAKVEAMKEQPPEDPQITLAKEQMQQKTQIEQGKLEIANGKLELEMAKMKAAAMETEAKIALLITQADTARASTTATNVTAIYEATQAAGVIAQNPGIAGVSDEILLSAGFVDFNAAPVVSEVASQMAQPSDTMAAPPTTAGVGKQQGIETPVLEARAAGGPVNAGQPYLVGEKGPEVVVPTANATVIPNEEIGGQNDFSEKAKAFGNGAYRGAMDIIKYPAQAGSYIGNKIGLNSDQDTMKFNAALGKVVDAPVFLPDSTRKDLNAASQAHPNYASAGDTTAGMLIGQGIFKGVGKTLFTKAGEIPSMLAQRAKVAGLSAAEELGAEPIYDSAVDSENNRLEATARQARLNATPPLPGNVIDRGLKPTPPVQKKLVSLQ